MTIQQYRMRSQDGGASLFIVIFAALLMMVITMSFVQMMLSDQRQASTMDLSQSAYDSAQAGVEDAKRALLLELKCGSDTSPQCSAAKSALGATNKDCNMVRMALTGDSSMVETPVRKTGAASNNDALLQQAYTCAKITSDTDDYIKSLKNSGDSTLVPLKGVSAFDGVRVSWFTSEDAGGATSLDLSTDTKAPLLQLDSVNGWKETTPSVLRAQFMQTGSSFTLDQFDNSTATESNANTLFLYPSKAGLLDGEFATSDVRRKGDASPNLTKCEATLVSGTYACAMTLKLPDAVGGGSTRNNAFLYLTTLYNRASVKVELLAGSTVVPFDGVQPIADVTGRANDVFRRVKSRIELGDAVYPSTAVDVNGNLCKNFSITDDTSDYVNNCTP